MKIRALLFFISIVLLVTAGYLAEERAKHETGIIKRAVDGDTIEMSNGNKIRLLGVNTPEKNTPFYQEAKNFLKDFENKEVDIYWTIENTDKYSRLLRYVFFEEKLLNEEILAKGLGNAYVYKEDKYTKRLRGAEEKARKRGIGLWERSRDKCGECFSAFIDNGAGKNDCLARGESVELKNNCDFSCFVEKWYVKDNANHVFVFGNISIGAGKSVVIYNGIGKENETSFYFNNKGECASVWNDEGDSLFLRDKEGRLAFYEAY
ncbi:MAG: thermonuclease family protein [Nanoarchaeota archaeon]